MAEILSVRSNVGPESGADTSPDKQETAINPVPASYAQPNGIQIVLPRPLSTGTW